MHISLKYVGFNRQRGDTLVEVLIAIAVVSLILGGAYATTNRSLYATRSAQERGNALKLAESQMEQLKALAATNPTAIFSGPSPFCISNTGAVFDATNAACAVGPDGAAVTKEPIFRLSIERNGNTFTLTERWTNVSGRNQEQLQMRYRVYD